MPPLLSFQTALQLLAYEAWSPPPRDFRITGAAAAAAEVSSSGAAPREKQSFVRVIGQICLSAANESSPLFHNNSYNNACRGLQNMLVQSYSSLYTSDQEWLRVLMDSCDSSTVPSLRLLSCKLVCSLLTLMSSTNTSSSTTSPDEAASDSAADGSKFSPLGRNAFESPIRSGLDRDAEADEMLAALVGGHSLVETTIKLLKACCDSDHQIRGQAVTAFGQYSSGHWKSLRHHDDFLSVRTDQVANITGVDTSVRAAVLQCLIVACGDHVGTVRTAAQKCLGEAIVSGGLVVRGSDPFSPRKIFIIEGSNAVKERQVQAQQVQAEALAKAMAQVQAQAIAESQSPAERVAQITAQMSQAEAAAKALRNTPRRSHQIDRTIKHEIPAPVPRYSPDIKGLCEVRPGDSCVNTVAPGAYFDVITAVLQCLQDGCADSKLAVRLQATWALGNLLLLILPLRQKETFSPFSASAAIASVSFAVSAPATQWTCDQMWFGLCDICLGLLEDSDKLLASTVRCLGFLAAGLSPWDGTHFSHLSAIVTALIQKVLLSGLTTQQDRDEYLLQSIQEHPHKLVFSVCQSLGFVGWVLVNRGDKDADGVTPGVTECIDNVRAVQAAMLRYGRVKVQLQACKALISLTHNDESNSPGAKVSPNTAAFLAGNFASPVTSADKQAPLTFFPSSSGGQRDNSMASFAFGGGGVGGGSGGGSGGGGGGVGGGGGGGVGGSSAIDGGLLNESVLALGRLGPESSSREVLARPDSLLRALEAALVVSSSLSVPLPATTALSTPLISSLSTFIAGKYPPRPKPSVAAATPGGSEEAAGRGKSESPPLPTSIPNIIVVSNINAAIMPTVRTSSLQRALLVLLWVMFRRVISTFGHMELSSAADSSSSAGAARLGADERLAREAVAQILLYHADALAEWLEGMLADASPLHSEELSMTAPPLASTAPPLSMLADSTPRVSRCLPPFALFWRNAISHSPFPSIYAHSPSCPSSPSASCTLCAPTAQPAPSLTVQTRHFRRPPTSRCPRPKSLSFFPEVESAFRPANRLAAAAATKTTTRFRGVIVSLKGSAIIREGGHHENRFRLRLRTLAR